MDNNGQIVRTLLFALAGASLATALTLVSQVLVGKLHIVAACLVSAAMPVNAFCGVLATQPEILLHKGQNKRVWRAFAIIATGPALIFVGWALMFFNASVAMGSVFTLVMLCCLVVGAVAMNTGVQNAQP